jgi:hypothetical protein
MTSLDALVHVADARQRHLTPSLDDPPLAAATGEPVDLHRAMVR